VETETKTNQPPAMPPPMLLYQIGVGHYFSRALYLAAKFGVADHLKDGPRHFSELAKVTETHAPALNRMMRLLASVGVFEERAGGNFALTPLSQFLCSGVPGSMRYAVMLFAGVPIQDAWRDLEYCVRTGEPAFRRTSPDADAFSTIAQNPEQAKIFDEAMAAFAPQTSAAIAAAYDFSQFGTVIDVGGGNGALLLGILGANPKLRGIVFDRPPAIEGAKVKLAAAGLESRCRAVGGDFFEAVPDGGDAYLLKHVIHDWNDDRAVAILKNCHRAMNGRGKLIIAEGVYPVRIEQSDICRGAAANDVNMLVSTGGRQRSEAEFRSLYDAAGFRLTKLVPTPARLSLIEGDPK
jgi:SAM-dependent methyltransferase